jgi:hypothetical protein
VVKPGPVVAGRLDIPPAWRAALLAGVDGVTKNDNGATAAGKFDDIDQTKFDIAGKTGTAQTCNTCWDNAFFTGFAPAAAPRYLAVAMLEQAGFGADSAAPVVNDLFLPLSKTGAFPPVTPTIPIAGEAPPTTRRAPSSTTTTTLYGVPPGSVPDTTIFGAATTTTTPGADTGETTTTGPAATGGTN